MICEDLLLQFNFITVIMQLRFCDAFYGKTEMEIHFMKKFGCKIYSDPHVLSIDIEFPF